MGIVGFVSVFICSWVHSEASWGSISEVDGKGWVELPEQSCEKTRFVSYAGGLRGVQCGLKYPGLSYN